MEPQRDDVRRLMELLLCLLKRPHSDELTLRFTVSAIRDPLRQLTEPAKLAGRRRAIRYEGELDLFSFGTVFLEMSRMVYQETTIPPLEEIGLGGIYVPVIGPWVGGADARSRILEMSQLLNSGRIPHGQVRAQTVSFGNDKEGLECLPKLIKFGYRDGVGM